MMTMKQFMADKDMRNIPGQNLQGLAAQVMLTNRCNLQCRICNIYREKNKTTLSLGTLKNLIQAMLRDSGRIECLNLTGGEPLLEYELILRLLKTVIPLVAAGKIKEFNINTNGTLTESLKAIVSIIPPPLKNRFSFSITLHGWKEEYSRSESKQRLFWTVTESIAFLRKHGYKVEINFVVSPFTAAYIYKAYRFARKFDCRIEYAFYTTRTRSFYHYSKSIESKGQADGWMRENAGQWDQIIEDGAVKCRKYQIKHLRDYMKNGSVPVDVFRRCLRPLHVIFVRCTGEVYTCFQGKPVSRFTDFKEQDWKSFKEGRERMIQSIRSRGCARCLLGALKWDYETLF